jgi:hypothetical protein
MRSLTKDIIDQDVYLIPTEPIVLSNGKFGDGGFPSTGGWSGGNSSSSFAPPIQYYLKDRINTANAKLEIFDASGTLIQTIPASKRKGINKVYWNLRMKPPSVATGGTKIDGGGFLGPMVLPGVYTVKLTIGAKEYTGSLTAVHDSSNKNFTIEDRKLQYHVAMQCYHMHERLAHVVDDINAKQLWIKQRLDSVQDKKSRKLLTAFNDTLERLRTMLLASKQKSIFADEKKLREDISDVYGSVAGSEARPSNLQIDRVKELQERVGKAEKDDLAINGEYASSVNLPASQQTGHD